MLLSRLGSQLYHNLQKRSARLISDTESSADEDVPTARAGWIGTGEPIVIGSVTREGRCVTVCPWHHQGGGRLISEITPRALGGLKWQRK